LKTARFYRHKDVTGPMRQITRYIVFELIKISFIVLSALTILMLLIGLVQRAVREGMGPLPVLRLIPYLLPDALRFAIPGTMLFAACSVYGRMSADNEIVAIKSLGISPMVVVWPAMVLAFGISLSAVWFNDVAVSWGRQGINRVILQSVEEIAYGTLRSQQSYSTRRFSIHVKQVKGRKLIRPTICFHAHGDSPPVTLVARQAELRFNPESNRLKIMIEDTQFDIGSNTHGQWPDLLEYELPLATISGDNTTEPGPSQIAMRDIPQRAGAQRSEIQQYKQAMAATAAYQMLTGDFSGLQDEQWNNRYEKLAWEKFKLNRLNTEVWRRWANGFSCLAFVFVGASLAILLRTADIWTSFGLCFLPILIVYYPVMQFGVDRAKIGELPVYSVWIGNLLLFFLGALFLRRVNRY